MINVSKMYCGLAGQSDHLRYERPHGGKPIAVFNCTARCNLRCQHCYSKSDCSKGDFELSTAQAKKLIDDLAAYQCPVILFSGGEPLLREDLFELMPYAVSKGLRTVISTNGTLIDQAKARQFAQIGVSYVGVSLDGPEHVHDSFRATKGCFKAAIKGVRHCHDAGVKAGLRFTITKENHQYVSDIFDIAKNEGVRRICFYHLVRTGRAKQFDNDYPSPAQVRMALDIIFERTKKFTVAGLVDEVLTVGNHADGPYLLMRMGQEKNPAYDDARQLLVANGGNKSGQNISCIAWDGSVYADQFWRNYCLGNALENSFAQIWGNSADPVLKMLCDKDHYAAARCKSCRWFELCKGNLRFLGSEASFENWVLEPPCYLTDEEISQGGCK